MGKDSLDLTALTCVLGIQMLRTVSSTLVSMCFSVLPGFAPAGEALLFWQKDPKPFSPSSAAFNRADADHGGADQLARLRQGPPPLFERQPGWSICRWVRNTLGLRTGVAKKPSARWRRSESCGWFYYQAGGGKLEGLLRLAAFDIYNGVWDGFKA